MTGRATAVLQTTSRLRLHVLALLLLCSCSSGVPTAEDFPVIAAQAAGAEPVRSGESAAWRGVRVSLKAMQQLQQDHEAAVSQRFLRPQLRSYLFLPDSYVGGRFPREIAVLLREVERLERDYIASLGDYPAVLHGSLAAAHLSAAESTALEEEMVGAFNAAHAPMLELHHRFLEFVGKAAAVYELVAARPGSIRATLAGVEISDPGLGARFDRMVDEVNAARDELERTVQRLPPEQRAALRRLGLTLTFKS